MILKIIEMTIVDRLRGFKDFEGFFSYLKIIKNHFDDSMRFKKKNAREILIKKLKIHN